MHMHVALDFVLAIYEGELGSPPHLLLRLGPKWQVYPNGSLLVTSRPCQIYYSLTGLVIRGNI